MTIRQATPRDIPAIQAMAEVVFRVTYADILTTEQLDYMMQWMYSAESLADQISGTGKEFFIAEGSDNPASFQPAGYTSVERDGTTPDGRPLYHLQKLYVMPSQQGKGLGSKLFRFITAHLGSRHPSGCRVELNVNRHNPAVAFYERMGMYRHAQGDFAIGHGYYMNDYIYALDIPAQ